MSTAEVNAVFAATLVDEWVRAGVTHAVVSPGSRNTPLLLALARDGRVTVDVVLDERSAAFRALGIGIASGRPAIVCCTSGTAAANFHPAVLEAHHAGVPLLVCTADRPPELQDHGAPQTIDQTTLFAGSVRWFHDPGPPTGDADAPARTRALAARAVAHATGAPAGPVHLNLPFREPLVPPDGFVARAADGRAGGAPWVRTVTESRVPGPATVEHLAALASAGARGLVVAGWGARVTPATMERLAACTGWPVLADPLSQLRSGPHAVSTYEALLRVEKFAVDHHPDVVVRVGAPLTSKIANAWLDAGDAPMVLVDEDDRWLDPTRRASTRVVASADATLGLLADVVAAPTAPEWSSAWRAADAVARTAIDTTLDGAPVCEARIARDVAAAVPDGSALVVASSLPVRALEWSMASRRGLRVVANRGVNGIDGFVSTARGVARAHAGPTVALTGDLGFLHDTNGLLPTGGGEAITIVVIDNGGGGIFGYLPQAPLAEFTSLFATPQGLDPAAVARAHGVDSATVAGPDDLIQRLATPAEAPRVLVIPVDPQAALDAHRSLWDAVATAVS